MADSKLTQTALAKLLGLTQPTVSALARAGMPLTLAGATAWRKAHLDARLTRRRRRGKRPTPSGPADDTGPALEAIAAFAELASRDQARWLEQLRQALAALPEPLRERVVLPRELWFLLIGGEQMRRLRVWLAELCAWAAEAPADREPKVTRGDAILFDLAVGATTIHDE